MATICQLHADLRYYLCLEPVDNNDTEREIRSMVLGKDPEKWLAYTLKHIGSTKPEHLHRLLPEEWTE